MTFLHPEYLKLFLVLALLFPAWLWSLRFSLKARRQLGGKKLHLTSRPARLASRILRLAAIYAVLVCLILALARPQVMAAKWVPELRPIDVVFLLDTSPSMRARDIPSSRLDRAADVIAKFMEKKLAGDRFGLVSFSQNSLILAYLTWDPRNILFYLDYLREEPAVLLGTNIGGALKSGLAVVSRGRELDPEQGKNRTIFVLISDGEDHGDELEAALREVTQASVEVFCLGIGSREGGLIPLSGKGDRTVYLKDDEGQPIIATFDEGTLRRIARETGGTYYRAYTGQELDRVSEQILLKARDVRGFRRINEPQDLYRPLLLAAVGFFVVRILV